MSGITLEGGIRFPYTNVTLTEQINRVQNVYGRINELKLFPTKGVGSTIVEVQFRNGVISILAAKPRGSLGPVGQEPNERSIFLKIPHFPHEDQILAAALQDKFRFGSGRKALKAMANELSDKLFDIRNVHAITLEWLRMSAMKGQIVDGAMRVLYDLYQVFGVQKKTVYFDLANPNANIVAKTAEVARHMEMTAQGETMNGVRSLVSPEFFDKLTDHPNVKEKFLATQSAMVLASEDIRRGFKFGSMTFEEYVAVAPDESGTTRRFISANKGHAYPLGTQKAFATYSAPPDTIETVNMENTPEVFVSIERMRHGKGVDIHSESNLLPVCHRIEMLVELDAGPPP